MRQLSISGCGPLPGWRPPVRWKPEKPDCDGQDDFKSVDEYIASQPESVQSVIELVRKIIQKAVPGADEVISYQIPAYKMNGGAVIYFAGWKQHYSLYPATDQVVAACKDDLAPYEVSKGTIRFPLSGPVPVKLIARIAKLRAKEVADQKVPARKRR
jgi:uncharacterized protein YdhG (YjbR/CyaY superfamily)